MKINLDNFGKQKALKIMFSCLIVFLLPVFLIQVFNWFNNGVSSNKTLSTLSKNVFVYAACPVNTTQACGSNPNLFGCSQGIIAECPSQAYQDCLSGGYTGCNYVDYDCTEYSSGCHCTAYVAQCVGGGGGGGGSCGSGCVSDNNCTNSPSSCVGQNSCTFTFNNTNCGDKAPYCSKTGVLKVVCSDGTKSCCGATEGNSCTAYCGTATVSSIESAKYGSSSCSNAPAACSLDDYDCTNTYQDSIKRSDITELRLKVKQGYQQSGFQPPSWADTTLTSVKTGQFNELCTETNDLKTALSLTYSGTNCSSSLTGTDSVKKNNILAICQFVDYITSNK